MSAASVDSRLTLMHPTMFGDERIMFARSDAVMCGSTVPETSNKRTQPGSTNVNAKKDNANNCTCGMDNKVITSMLMIHCGSIYFGGIQLSLPQ